MMHLYRNPEAQQRQWIEAVPGLPNDTFVAYGGPHFQKSRQRLHAQILADLLKDCRPNRQPQAILMMGGPASGKSTALKVLDTEGFIKLDSDAVKEKIPEYQTAVSAKARNAAAMAHEESSYIIEVALEEAVKNRCNIVYDGTGKNAAKYARLIDMFHDHGYVVRLIYIHVEPRLALPRALARAEHSGRYVPPYVIESAYASIPYNFGDLANRADAWMMFDTTEFPARYVANKEPGTPTQVRRPELLEEFQTRFPQRTGLRLNPGRRSMRHNPAPVNAKQIENALSVWLRSGKDENESGLD